MSVHRAVVISVVVGIGAALSRSLVFHGQAMAQDICSLIVGLAVVTYGVARLFDRDRQLSGGIYLAITFVGLALAGLGVSRLLL